MEYPPAGKEEYITLPCWLASVHVGCESHQEEVRSSQNPFEDICWWSTTHRS